eukprot:5062617-Prymnesium_polylepis.2
MHAGKWGSKAYLESLHRTYQIPLPRRDDGAFERALQFRTEEKDFYSRLQQENEQLRHRLGKLENTFSNLEQHSNTLLQFYNDTKTSSKAKVVETDGDGKSAADSARGSRSDAKPVHDGATGPSGRNGRGEGRADEVPGEVLPPKLPDTSGQADQHLGDGPKPGQGDESGRATAESV